MNPNVQDSVLLYPLITEWPALIGVRTWSGIVEMTLDKGSTFDDLHLPQQDISDRFSY
jgi:hypothetical protein